MAFLPCGRWISTQFVVIIRGVKKQKQAIGKDSRGS